MLSGRVWNGNQVGNGVEAWNLAEGQSGSRVSPQGLCLQQVLE